MINRVLLARSLESRFVSLFLSTLSADGHLVYCNAGQNPPLLFSAGELTRLETGGTLIGAFPQAVFDRGSATLKPGDTLILYSDGVSEAENGAGEEFGEAGISQAVTTTLTAITAGDPRRTVRRAADIHAKRSRVPATT